MEFIDLAAQQLRIKSALDRRISTVLAHGRYIMGPEVSELEEKLAEFCGAKHCISCASGSTALDLILLAWGIGPGDAVLTTPLTFIATAECIARIGAVPVFVDIDPHSLNLDPACLERALAALATGDATLYPLPRQAISTRLTPRAIITVDLFGHPAEYDRILPLARSHGLKTLEDAAQSFGGRYQGQSLCACGCDAAATSFFPAKPLGCYGDGGAIFTDDDATAALLDSLRYHGRHDAQNKYENVRLGMNGRLDTLQAAILLAKLEIFAEELDLRQAAALRYDALAGAVPGLTPPALPAEPSRSAWAQYTVLLPHSADRSAVAGQLKAAGIPTTINYPKGLHAQTAFAGLGYAAEDFPVTLDESRRALSLPMHPYLQAEEQKFIMHTLAQALERCQ